ncbi:MAG: isochorismatase family protein [Candidatus Thorarchaeota archaeon]
MESEETLLTVHQSLEPNESVLVLIDPQEKLMPYVKNHQKVTENIILLIEATKVLSIPIVVTRQYSRGLGDIIAPLKERLLDYANIIPDKLSFDCFQSDIFADALTGFGTILVAGVETHICVNQTVLSALRADYDVHVASDAVSSRSDLDWEIGLNRMERAGAIKSSTEMIVYELLKEAGTPEFKALLPLLKNR